MPSPSSNNLITEIVVALMGGGMVTAAANLYKARNERRVTDVAERKAPVEINLSSLEGAEKAVLSLGKALDAANSHAAQIEADLQEKVEQVRELRRECQALREQLLQAKRALRYYLADRKGTDDRPDQGILDGLTIDEG